MKLFFTTLTYIGLAKTFLVSTGGIGLVRSPLANLKEW
jgi:hypothetical protein